MSCVLLTLYIQYALHDDSYPEQNPTHLLLPAVTTKNLAVAKSPKIAATTRSRPTADST
jgi:hypothetical protein